MNNSERDEATEALAAKKRPGLEKFEPGTLITSDGRVVKLTPEQEARAIETPKAPEQDDSQDEQSREERRQRRKSARGLQKLMTEFKPNSPDWLLAKSFLEVLNRER
jgi:hypothetical protein